MRKKIFLLGLLLFLLPLCLSVQAAQPEVRLGSEVLFSRYHRLIAGKKVGLVTNQSGVNRNGESTLDLLAKDSQVDLVALYGPEHGIDGKASAGEYVQSYIHPKLQIPVYSLYGATRMPTPEMLADIDLLIFDIQDIGARSYTYMSTLNYCLVAARREGIPVIVLDRPNPVGGTIVEGPMMEDKFITFVGVDNLPMAHGMTAGELARFFNRKIGAELIVIPLENYTRDMIYQDTGLPWVPTSPNIPDIASVFGYMATGLGEGTGIGQADKFKWIGGTGIDASTFADRLNSAGLPGVTFVPENQGTRGGVRLQITDYRKFNPAKTGLTALAIARSLNHFTVPKSGATIVMFDKIMGTDKIGQYLEQYLTPAQIEANYTPGLAAFRAEREKYLIYDTSPRPAPGMTEIAVFADGKPVQFDAAPFIDGSKRTQVPIRAISEALGAEVVWHEDNSTVTIAKPGTEVTLTIGRSTAAVNGSPLVMDTQAMIKNARTYVPLRFVSEAFTAVVTWRDEWNAITIIQ